MGFWGRKDKVLIDEIYFKDRDLFTWMSANDIAIAAAHTDLSSKYHVISSTQPLLKAWPVTVSLNSGKNDYLHCTNIRESW